MGYDCIVVGCGLSGSVVARFLADTLSCHVLMLEKRDHVGGNMYDYYDEHGILVHKYGPHTFHTNSETAYRYICQYADWTDYKLQCMAKIDGVFTPTPFNFQTIDDFYSPQEAKTLKDRIGSLFKDRPSATILELLGHSDSLIQGYAQFLFNEDYSLYTAKQWGISPSHIDPSVLRRVPVQFSYEKNYFCDTYQVMPTTTYQDFFQKLLDHPAIDISFNTNALDFISISQDGTALLYEGNPLTTPVIYTGPLDELFSNRFGPLPYRTLRFEWKHDAIDSFQPAAVVAYPQEKNYTRITEYKKLPHQVVDGTSYAIEYSLQYRPGKDEIPYYPILTQESQIQHERYSESAKAIPNLFCCGRLADFRYYNMDQALLQALSLCKTIEKTEAHI